MREKDISPEEKRISDQIAQQVRKYSPWELLNTLRQNEYRGPLDGPEIITQSFGSLPVIFTAPHAVKTKYRSSYGGDDYVDEQRCVAKAAIVLAILSDATLVLPVRSYPYLTNEVKQNHLTQALSEAVKAKHISLLIAIDAGGVYQLEKGKSQATIEHYGGKEIRGWPNILPLLEQVLRNSGVRNIRKQYEQGSSEGLWVREHLSIPAILLKLSYDLIGDEEGYSEYTMAYAAFLQRFPQFLSPLVSYCNQVKSARGLQSLPPFEEESRLIRNDVLERMRWLKEENSYPEVAIYERLGRKLRLSYEDMQGIDLSRLDLHTHGSVK